MKKIIIRLLGRMGYTLQRKHQHTVDDDIAMEPEFLEIYEQCKDYTMVSAVKSYALYKAVQYISRNKIPGDFVECGVWKGGQAMLISLTLQKEGDLGRRMYLYDTYAGMVEPTALDVHVGNKETALETWKKEDQGDHNDWCYASLEEVKANIVGTGYTVERLVFVVGKVEETIPKTIPGPIALLRLDTDWYESTYHELRHMYPLIVKDGVLIIDDYGTWEGSRKAVDQYMEENHLKMLLTKIGRSGRIGVKPE